MRNTSQRREQILQLLVKQGGVQVSELASLTGVSAVTIRTDLAQLETQGLATRNHGGATLVRTPPQAEVTGKEIAPGAEIESDQQIENYVRDTAATMYHPVGTCTMGTHDQAVVDPELRVRGIANLRVIDASIMPEVPRANTHLTTVAIAERMADRLKAST